jgi:hypothetical protein
LGRLRVEAQSTTSRINKKTAAQQVTTDSTDLAGVGRASGELADARDFNATWDLDPTDFVPGLPGRLHDPYEYDVLRTKPVFGLTGDWDDADGVQNVRNQIDTGLTIPGYDDGTITWGIWDFKAKVGYGGNGESQGFFPFTQAQIAAARISIANWDELVATDFEEVDISERDVRDWAHGDAPDIIMANTLSGPAQAWAYYPTPSSPNNVFARIGSDVWIGAANDNRTDLFDGGYGLMTQVHELGHSLGLSHPGNYDFGDDNDGDGIPDPITYLGDAFYFQDNRQYSVMSYFDSYDVGSNNIDWNLMRFMYASTPMVHDIWIIQQKYGVETTTRTGDSIYGFNWSSDVKNTAMQFVADERMAIFSIWDANGNDTLDLSGYYTPSIIDLREGAYSSAGGLGAYDAAWVGADPSTMTKEDYLAFVNANQLAAGYGTVANPVTRTAAYDLYFGGREGVNEEVPWSEIVGKDWLMENNIGIAYGAVIENAVGGHGDDRINGNWETNRLTGGDGADTFIIFDDSGTTLAGANRTDTRLDYITDFATGEDQIDLTEFASVGSDNVSYVGGQLLIDTNDDGTADFIVDLAGRPIDTTNDIVYA